MSAPVGERVADVVRAAGRRLAQAGIASPEHDAQELVAAVLGVARGDLARLDVFPAEHAARLRDLLARRAAREPLQHLLGTAPFRRIELQVGPGVFVPRPETESLVEWCLQRLAEHPAPVVVDLCTGAGTVALSVAHECPRARVYAVEREAGAFGWLQRNAAARASAGDRPVTCVRADVAVELPDLGGRVDLVVSNPPYVADHERPLVDPEVADHDPPAALWAGPDGLDLIRLVQVAARRLLRPGGSLAVEHSDRQGATVPALLEQAGGWTQVSDHRDLAGRDRFTTARWSP